MATTTQTDHRLTKPLLRRSQRLIQKKHLMTAESHWPKLYLRFSLKKYNHKQKQPIKKCKTTGATKSQQLSTPQLSGLTTPQKDVETKNSLNCKPPLWEKLYIRIPKERMLRLSQLSQAAVVEMESS